ncbi:MAG: ferredoxin--NADP reductase [Chlorobi bacterium]|nr:ferredoxin--NADP reductase [Chlorobiota bacterium]
MENKFNAVVTQIIQVSPSMKIFRIAPDGWELPDFKPGQFTALALPGSAPRVADATPNPKEFDPDKMIKRVYSIASSSKSKQFIEFYISLVRSGALTPRLFALEIGDKIELGKKMVGMFTLEQVPEDHNIVLVATGTGVAPYVSMLRSNILGGGKRKIAVIHGAANSWDLGYSSELMLLESLSDRFTYIPTILDSQNEPAAWNGDTRFVQDMWADGVIDNAWGIKPMPDNTHVFLCGNPKMVESMFELLAKDGFKEHKRKEPGEIHIESWG